MPFFYENVNGGRGRSLMAYKLFACVCATFSDLRKTKYLKR
jgi:hypothetical protein